MKTNPTANRSTSENTPIELMPVSTVIVLTRNVPMTEAYLPKMSKKPKYSLACSVVVGQVDCHRQA